MSEPASQKHRVVPASTAQRRAAAAPRPPSSHGARIGVVSTIYHQQPDAEPIAVEARFSRWLESSEQPYLRKLTIGEKWTPLDLGWLQGAGRIFLKNEEGRFAVQPTQEEREATMSRIVELAVVEPITGNRHFSWGKVRPGESLCFEPTDPTSVRLRCQRGQARVTLLIVPN